MRYLAFEILSEARLSDFKPINDVITANSLGYLGEIELGKASFTLINDLWNPDKQRGIIKFNHKYVHRVIASLALISQINDRQVIFRTLGVSGTIRKASQKYLQ